jgi:AAA+ ATPase superfamily predicted ATPase
VEFLNRTEEQLRLKTLLDSSCGEFACVYGRRRCGKTRLLREVTAGRANVVYFLADQSEKSLQIERLKEEIARQVPVFGNFAIADWGKLFDLWLEFSPKGSTLVLDEFPYLVRMAPELPSVIQRTVDVFGDSGNKIIVCGSSQRMMQGFVLSSSEPLYGRAREIIKVDPLDFKWLESAFPGKSFEELFKLWAVYGGVPRYWELAQGDADWLSSIKRNIINPLGVLHDEPQFLLMDEVGDFAKASSLLAIIGGGANRLSEIAVKLGKKATELSYPLKRLADLGFIVRESPFGADPENGKKSIYRISDSFLDFWYTFVLPNKSRPEFLEDKQGCEEFLHKFNIFLGRAWERLVRIRLAKEWRGASRWWGTGNNRQKMEFDIVAESFDGKELLVGEAKLSAGEKDMERIKRELAAKVEALPFRRKYDRVRLEVFVAS